MSLAQFSNELAASGQLVFESGCKLQPDWAVDQDGPGSDAALNATVAKEAVKRNEERAGETGSTPPAIPENKFRFALLGFRGAQWYASASRTSFLLGGCVVRMSRATVCLQADDHGRRKKKLLCRE